MSDKLVNIKNLNDLAKKLDKRNNDNIAIISEKINEIEEFVNESINNIPEGFSGDYNDLTNKPTASDIGAATEEYVNEKIAEIRDEMVILEEDDLSMEGIIDNTFPNLTTTDKTLIGAINELNNKLEKAPSGGDVPSEGIETEIEKAVIDEMLMDIFGITVEEGE